MIHHARRRRGNGAAGSSGIRPAPERFRADHVGGPVIRAEASMADVNGAVSRPWKVLDTLARMERAKTITRSMRAAGMYFGEAFNKAGLDPLWAADPTRTPVLAYNGQAPGARRGSQTAVGIVLDSLQQLGGISSPGGSCAWHVLGLEYTIESWAISRGWSNRPITAQVATGILLTDLGILQNYYAIP